MENLIEVKTFSGKIMLDVSDDACAKYGFRSGDRFKSKFETGCHDTGTIIGVGRLKPDSPDMLWMKCDDNDFIGHFGENPQNNITLID
jgi:hypothetical protein